MLLPRGENNPARAASSTIAHFWLELKTEYGPGSVLVHSVALHSGIRSCGVEMLVLIGC